MARPKVLPDSMNVNIPLPLVVVASLDALAASTGTTRATVLRHVVVAGLQPFVLLDPDLAAALPTTTLTKKEQDQ